MRDSDSPSEAPLHSPLGRPGDVLLGRSLALVRLLRRRCPWDARQDPRSLRPYLLEEAHEVAEAIAAGDDDELPGELGDLLLNLAFQIVLGEERGAFDARGVVEGLEAKMEARHPHIYGDAEEPADWEALKARERAGAPSHAGDRAAGGEAAGGDASEPPDEPFAGLAAGLEPLSRALRAQDRMAGVGFDWPDAAGPLAKLREELDELERLLPEAGAGPPRGPEADPPAGAEGPSARERERREAAEEELGDVLFAAVNLARRSGVHPGNALLAATRKFERRCRAVWRLAAERGLDPRTAGLERLDALWDEVKAREA